MPVNKKTEITDSNFSDSAADRLTSETGDILRDQPKVRVKLNFLKSGSDKSQKDLEALIAAGQDVKWPAETVYVNGYPYIIAYGKSVEVPQTVAEILEQADLI